MQFMFSANPMEPTRVDDYFKPQAKALVTGRPAVFSLEGMTVSHIGDESPVVYRGWMLNASEYDRMRRLVESNPKLKMLTSLRQYLNTHHLPNWYPLLRDYTPETFIIDNMMLNDYDLVKGLKRLGWEQFLLKDYVKSLKTAGGSITTPEQAPQVVELMKKFRGSIEGGLCVRKFETLHSEKRYFIVNGRILSTESSEPRVCIDFKVLDIVAKRIDSPFYSVDIAHNDNGEPRVVEIGDGQVSDLVGWDVDYFAATIIQAFS